MQTVLRLTIDKNNISLNRQEGLRYIGCPAGYNSEIIEDKSIRLAERITSVINPGVCYLRVPVSVDDDRISCGVLDMKSERLARLLKDCDEAFLFAATTGSAVDREIARQSRISAIDGLICDAMGSAAIEALCDTVCDRFGQISGRDLLPRFSPGYSGLALETQRDFLRVLDSSRLIGLSLTEGMMMTPVKSVTAIVGIKNKI